MPIKDERPSDPPVTAHDDETVIRQPTPDVIEAMLAERRVPPSDAPGPPDAGAETVILAPSGSAIAQASAPLPAVSQIPPSASTSGSAPGVLSTGVHPPGLIAIPPPRPRNSIFVALLLALAIGTLMFLIGRSL